LLILNHKGPSAGIFLTQFSILATFSVTQIFQSQYPYAAECSNLTFLQAKNIC